jgi:hypothetical protein
VRQHLVSVLQLDAEHGIGQWLDHRAFEHDGVFLGLGQVTLS